MRRFKILIGSLALVAAISLLWTGLANAYNIQSGTNVTVGQNQKINDTLYVAGRTVDVNSEVFGDVFCAGQTVTISGTIHGDVICAGQTLNITGIVDGDVRLAGQTVTVGAVISGNATIAGQSFNLESTGKIGGDLTLGSTDGVLNGSVGRDVVGGGNSLILSSGVGRNVKATAQTLKITSGAEVKGNIDYTSKLEADIASGAKVIGKITRTEPTKGSNSKHGAIFGFAIGWFIYLLLSMLFTAFVIVLLFPRVVHSISQHAVPTPWKALLTGFVATIAAPVVVFILAITVVGLPFAFMATLAWLLVLLVSGPLFGYYIGRQVLRDSTNPLLIMLTGVSILTVLYFIPIIGFLAFLAMLWVGSGMILLEIFNKTPKPAYKLSAKTSNKK